MYCKTNTTLDTTLTLENLLRFRNNLLKRI